jgi:hypothetical protein
MYQFNTLTALQRKHTVGDDCTKPGWTSRVGLVSGGRYVLVIETEMKILERWVIIFFYKFVFYNTCYLIFFPLQHMSIHLNHNKFVFYNRLYN